MFTIHGLIKKKFQKDKINLINKFFNFKYDAIIIAVAHKKFKDLNVKSI